MATKEMPAATITADTIEQRFCPHCEMETMQVGPPPEGWLDFEAFTKAEADYESGESDEVPGYGPGHCLQCMADGGTCCSLKSFSRWKKN